MANGQQHKNKEAKKPRRQERPAVQAVFYPTVRATV